MGLFGRKQPPTAKAALRDVLLIWQSHNWTVEDERDDRVILNYHTHLKTGTGGRTVNMNSVAARVLLRSDGDTVTVEPLRPRPRTTVGALTAYKACVKEMREKLAAA